MSTSEHVNEHDTRSTGPTIRPGRRTSTPTSTSTSATSSRLWLAVAMVISVGIVYGTFWFFEGQAASRPTRWRRSIRWPWASDRSRRRRTCRRSRSRTSTCCAQAENEKLTQLRLGRQGRRRRAHPDRSRDGSDAADAASRRAPTAATRSNVVTQDSSSGRTTVRGSRQSKSSTVEQLSSSDAVTVSDGDRS